MVFCLLLFVCSLLLLPSPTAGFGTTPDQADAQHGGLRRRRYVVRRGLDEAPDGTYPQKNQTSTAVAEKEGMQEGSSNYNEDEMEEAPERDARKESSMGSEGGGCPDSVEKPARNSTTSIQDGEAKENAPHNSHGDSHSDHGEEAKESDSAPTTNTTAGQSNNLNNAGDTENKPWTSESATAESSRHDDHDENHNEHNHHHHHHHEHSETPDLPTAPSNVIRRVCRQCRKCRRVYEKYMEGYQFCQVCVEICPSQYRGALAHNGNSRFRRLSDEEAKKPEMTGNETELFHEDDEEKKDAEAETVVEGEKLTRSDSSESEGGGCPGNVETSGDQGGNPSDDETKSNHNEDAPKHNDDHGMGMSGDGKTKTTGVADAVPDESKPPTKADEIGHVAKADGAEESASGGNTKEKGGASHGGDGKTTESAPDGNSPSTSLTETEEKSNAGMDGTHAAHEHSDHDEHHHHDKHNHDDDQHNHHGAEHGHHHGEEEHDDDDDDEEEEQHAETPELPMAPPRVIRGVCRHCRKCRRIYENYSQGYKFCQVCVEICPSQYRGSLPIHH